jgi:transcriptional regulator with XRE-family HTH domain
MDRNERIGRRMQMAREFNHLKQSHVAEKFGIAPNTLSKWEHGQHNFTAADVQKAADLFQLKPEWFESLEAPTLSMHNEYGPNGYHVVQHQHEIPKELIDLIKEMVNDNRETHRLILELLRQKGS